MVTFLITGGAAFIFGLAVSMVLTKTKVRSPAVAGAVTFAVSLVFLYFAWSTWLFALLRRGDEAADVSWISITLQPWVVWDLMKKVNEVGAWNFKGSTPTGGILWALWLVEAALLVGIPTWLGLMVPRKPFCESTNEWLSEERALLVGAGRPDAEIKQKAEVSDFATLFVGVHDPGDVIRRDVWSTLQSELLTVVVKSIKTVTKGSKTETNSRDVVSHLRISRVQLENLRALGGAAEDVCCSR